MKKIILLLLVPVIISGCANDTSEKLNSDWITETAPIIEKNNNTEVKVLEAIEPQENIEENQEFNETEPEEIEESAETEVEPHDDTGLPPHRH